MDETPLEALGMVLGLSSLTLIPFFILIGILAFMERKS